MSTGSKKRRSKVRSYETKSPDPKQSVLKSRDHVVQRVLRTPTPANISEKRQETLTQIGYVVYQIPEDMDLNYDDDANEDWEETPRVRKRRKIGKEPAIPVTRQTRRSARRAAERTLKDEEDEQNLETEPEENRIPLEKASSALMPPPKTPQSTRRKEVPSSQSPADTPLSIQSKKSHRDLSRSPLKERSTNVRRVKIRDSPARKSVRWAQMLEVADSTEQDDEESLPSIPAPEMTNDSAPTSSWAQMPEVTDSAEQDDEESLPSVPAPEMTSSISINYGMTNNHTRTSGAGSTLPSSSVGALACPQQQCLNGDAEDASAPRTQIFKSEVSDSEADEDDDDFGVEIDTQAALKSIDTDLNNPNTKDGSIPITHTWTPRRVLDASEPTTSSKQRDWHSQHLSVNVDREPNISTTSFASNTQSSHPQLSNNSMTPQRPKRATAPSSSAHSASRSESEQVSLQLTHDLDSHTQTCIVPETQSQFESAWHEYKPAPPPSDDDRGPSEPDQPCPSDLTPRALESETVERNIPFEEPQLPILSPRTALPSSLNPPKQHPSSTAAISPSQTTTDETTQKSSAHSSSQQLRSLSPPPPLPAFACSTQSSQSRAPAADGYAGGWDGVPLTESQLLPDSLMNGTLVGPPSLAGSDWELEGEG